MRVLHLTHFHSSELPGGVQQAVDAHVAAQRSLGWTPAVVSGALALDDAGTVRPRDSGDARITTIHRRPSERFSGDLGSPRIESAVVNAAQAFAPDVCHVHHWHALTPTLVRTLATIAPVVVTLHDAYPTCPRFFRTRTPPELCAPTTTAEDCAACLEADLGMPAAQLTEVIARRSAEFAAELAAASRVVAVSTDLAARLRAVPSISGIEIDAVPLGLARVPGPVCPPTPAPGRLRLAHWCGVEARKGLDLVADAIAGSAHSAAFELHVYGREIAAGTIDRLRARMGRGQLEFHGPFEAIEGLRAIAATCDAALAPSLLPETYGLAVDEALSMGMPVVVGRTGAPCQRIGQRGIAVPTDSPEPLRDVLERWLRDPDELAKLRNGAHGARALDEHLQQIHEIYRCIGSA